MTLIEIPHPCGSAEKGGPPSKLLVSDASCFIEGGPLCHAHMGDDLEVHALHERGWTISAIARHTGFDRKYLAGDGEPGVRA